MFRIGHGYDVHRLVENRALFLGGVKIPYSKGLLGHSDADVIIHALCDALLGAMALGDIGKHFPDSDDKYKGISSIVLLKNVKKIMDQNNYIIGNCDITVIAQKPKLSPYTEEMRKNICNALCTEAENVNVKATTEERLGFTGREEGISAHAVALILKK